MPSAILRTAHVAKSHKGPPSHRMGRSIKLAEIRPQTASRQGIKKALSKQCIILARRRVVLDRAGVAARPSRQASGSLNSLSLKGFDDQNQPDQKRGQDLPAHRAAIPEAVPTTGIMNRTPARELQALPRAESRAPDTEDTGRNESGRSRFYCRVEQKKDDRRDKGEIAQALRRCFREEARLPFRRIERQRVAGLASRTHGATATRDRKRRSPASGRRSRDTIVTAFGLVHCGQHIKTQRASANGQNQSNALTRNGVNSMFRANSAAVMR